MFWTAKEILAVMGILILILKQAELTQCYSCCHKLIFKMYTLYLSNIASVNEHD